MAEQRRRQLFTIPAHHAFADSLAAGLIRRAGDPMALARATILLPNNRAVRAVTDAFVRLSEGALLLPRLVPLGDSDAGESIGIALDPIDAADPVRPAVPPERRRMMLARLIGDAKPGVTASEAFRLAGDLGRVIDQLLTEGVAPAALAALDLAPELSDHWQASLALLEIVLDRWPRLLADQGLIDAADRRTHLLMRAADRLRRDRPGAMLCAAGISDTAPAVAQLLRAVTTLPAGLVVFAGLDVAMPGEEWDALGPHRPDPVSGLVRRSIETHPQFVGKLLLERMGSARGEVAVWRDTAGAASDPARGRAIANALAPAAYTARWTTLAADQRRLTGVRIVEGAQPAEEAQAIALAMREVLEEPERTAALVTPDRGLARRVAALCARWGIEVDDSAGRPLSILPPGTLLLALTEAAAQQFAPLPLVALLKHPLVAAGEGRLDWLTAVRALDLALRGPRPPAGLGAIGPVAARAGLTDWWQATADRLAALERCFGAPTPLAASIGCLRDTAQSLAGDAIWAGPAGRAAADWLAAVEAEASHGPARIDPSELPALVRLLLDEVAVRPPQGGHPRLAIYGQIEARLQSADLMILGGLNEGIWPARPAPDPWLAPRIRAALGLPGLERRIGIAAHDFGQALGAPQVLITRSRRDADGPAIPSRLWLRLAALAGSNLRRDETLERWASVLDDPGEHLPASRPAPSPDVAIRPRRISVTEVDRLKADPFAFYARRVLGLRSLDAVDADPSAAWRGDAVHAILEAWWLEDRCAPAALRPRAAAMLARAEVHPILRALWQPRLVEAIDWIAAKVADNAAAGRTVLRAEGRGAIELAGIELSGRYDRIDRLAGGGIAIVDYKTGKAPSAAAVRAGYSMQLGLLGAIADRGGFDGVAGPARSFEYWSLAKARDTFGQVTSPVDDAGKGGKLITADFVAEARAQFEGAAARWLTGDEAFTAKLNPDFAPFTEYDQLMRLDEWYGRESR